MKYLILTATLLIMSAQILAFSEVESIIYDEACKQNFPYNIAVAVAMVESKMGKHKDTNLKRMHDGVGVFQVRASTARAYCNMSMHDMVNKKKNIRCGIMYLKSRFEKYGSYRLAVASYNSGSPVYCKTKKQMLKWKCKKGELINEQYITKVSSNLLF